MLKEKKQQTQPKISAVVHPATPEQERRMNEAIDLFLTEWVRRRMAQGENTCSTISRNFSNSHASS